MRKWMKTTATAAAMAMGMFAFSAGAANADIVTSGDGSVLSGNQAVLDVNVPINVCGNAVAVLVAAANASCENAHASVGDGGDDDHKKKKDDYYYHH